LPPPMTATFIDCMVAPFVIIKYLISHPDEISATEISLGRQTHADSHR